MNEILTRAFNFSNQPSQTDQESAYQEKYIAALEEKLKITQERDTMAKILEEKSAQLDHLIKYSAELERKLGISVNAVSEEKFVSWVDIVRKYFKSFNDDPVIYEREVENFLRHNDLPLEKIRSDCSPDNLYYGIPSSFHVEFAAHFSDLWQKLSIKDLSQSVEKKIVDNIVSGSHKMITPEKEYQEAQKKSSTRIFSLGVPVGHANDFISQISSQCSPQKKENIKIDTKRISVSPNDGSVNGSRKCSKSSSPAKRPCTSSRSSMIKEDSNSMDVHDDVISVSGSSLLDSPNQESRRSARISPAKSDPSSRSRNLTPVVSVYPFESSTRSSPRLAKKLNLSSDGVIYPVYNEESSDQDDSSDRLSPSTAKTHNFSIKFDSKNNSDISKESDVSLKHSYESPSRSISPLFIVSPPKDGTLKEYKVKGITMYIWIDVLNSFFPELVRQMKSDQELYKFAKSAVKTFLNDNYPSIGLSFKEMENQKLLYIPKPLEVRFKSWFREEFNSSLHCRPIDVISESSNSTPTYVNNQKNIANSKHKSDSDDSNIIKEGSCIPPKKRKRNCVRYNIILKDLFSEFNAQPKTSRARIRNAVKEYLLEKVESLQECKLLQKDSHGSIKVSYGVPREYISDFQKWALVQLRGEYGEKVPLADWER